MERVIGIDLGTFNSCVALLESGRPVVLSARTGQPTTPSLVAITQNDRRIVGHVAKRQMITNAENTVHAAKRLIGRRFESEQVQKLAKTAPYKIVEGPHGDPRIELRGRAYSVPEISAMILTEMRMLAEDYLGAGVTKAVITVPAYFNDGQRQATKDAGAIAGLEVIRIINEPTAAALAHGFDKKMDRTIAVYDLGGGTFDVSILEISSSGVFKVIATAGDTFLGGEDFDQRVIDLLADGFQSETGVDPRGDRVALQRLKDAAEKAKTDLSSLLEVHIKLPFLVANPGGEVLHLERTLLRSELEELTRDLVDRTLALCRGTIEEAGLDIDEIEEILLVGGMTRMPIVRHEVAALFGREPNDRVNPDEVVALGAAIQGAALVDETHDMVLLDVTPHTLGIVIAGGYTEPLIAQNSTVPVGRSKVFTTTRDGQTAVKILAMQGESRLASENDLLGEFALSGLRSAPAGQVSVEVTFDIDSDGIVLVRARDLETGKEHSINVTSTSGLTEAEVESMMHEASEHAVEAKTDAELLAAREELESLVASVEALLPKVRESAALSPFASDAIDKGIETVERARELIATGDVEEVRGHLDALQRTRRLFAGVAAAAP